MKIVLCGYHWIGCKALNILIKNKHDIYVYTHECDPHINSLESYCNKTKTNYTTKKITKKNLPFKPDLICSIYYRYIISEDIIKIVNGKIFNLHPSLLPEYKGCSSLTWAIINGEKKTGFSYHYLTKLIDQGNIILQKKVMIEEWDTQLSLYNRVMFEAIKDFEEVINKVSKGFEGFPQKNTGDYYKRGAPHNGIIQKDWSIEKIERFIRAMNYPPLPYARYNKKEIKTFEDFLKNEK